MESFDAFNFGVIGKEDRNIQLDSFATTSGIFEVGGEISRRNVGLFLARVALIASVYPWHIKLPCVRANYPSY